jgi:hypothetical protein
MSSGVATWWALLSAVAVINISAWLRAAATNRRRQTSRLQLLLCAGYVFGCAFRSFLPVFDIPRICLADTWLSSVLVGRSVATIAELCFAAQWAVWLHESARVVQNEFARIASRLIVPLILIAEICSWFAVLTTANLGHVFENSLWGISAVLVVGALLVMTPRIPARLRPLLATWSIGGIAYIAFMFIADVPMYWARWVADEAGGRSYLSLAQGVADASACKLVSFQWQDWKHEVAWMSLYFSVGVWVSLSLVFIPTPGAVPTSIPRATPAPSRLFP